ncbi:putative amidoligase enzyme-domain-containing protein [Rhexocercosporidium sp. MPI-PUGE-AT-0058]|nr:putative amidoligase enzyme-domain-containing protein [Rhexocercosporidium sp. MPI-PUGE-AT-0058]
MFDLLSHQFRGALGVFFVERRCFQQPSPLLPSKLTRERHSADLSYYSSLLATFTIIWAPNVVPTTMVSALTFGVELEFLMAYLPDDTPPPDPSESRLLRLEYTKADISTYHDLTKDISNSRHTDENGGRLICAKRHIRTALSAAGLPIRMEEITEHDRSDFSGWDIVEDGSIDEPEDTPYRYLQLEVRSPAYIFTPSALSEVRLACQTLAEDFCLLSVETSALHVHVGDGERSFDDETTRKLAAFIWAFEPQLNSIHPLHRQNTYYTTSMRASSRYSTWYQERYDRIPSGITGALDLLACADIAALCEQIKDESGYLKSCQVSFCGIKAASTNPEHGKKTVEWRQHEGTLDGEEVTNWIAVVMGIMYFVRDAPTRYFFDVLSFALLETWQKVGDGRDGEREREFGPILAEGLFPVDRMLWVLMIDGQAGFYKDKWYRHPKTRPSDARKSRIVWEYERVSVPGSDEFVKSDRLRWLWEDLCVLWDLDGTSPALDGFDPESSMWPAHSLRVDFDWEDESVGGDEFIVEHDLETLNELGIWMGGDNGTEVGEGEEEEEGHGEGEEEGYGEGES